MNLHLYHLELFVLLSMMAIWNNCHCFICHSERFPIRNGYSIRFVRDKEERQEIKVSHPLYISSSIMGESNNDELIYEIESELREIVNKRKVSTVVTLKNQSLVDKINDLVEQRAEARRQQNYAKADDIRQELMTLEIIQDDKLLQIMIEDIPYKQGGGSTWSLLWMGDEERCSDEDSALMDDMNVQQNHNDDKKSIIQLAHMALGLAIHASSVVARHEYDNKTIDFFQKELASITNQALVSFFFFSLTHHY